MFVHAWEKNPLLLGGLLLFLGILFALQTPWALAPFLLLLPFTPSKRFPLLLFLFLFPLPYLQITHTFPSSGTYLEGKFSSNQVTEIDRFSQGWTYRGTLKTKEGKLHATLYSPEPLNPNTTYQIKGIAQTKEGRFYRIKPLEPWRPLKRHISLTKWRFEQKKAIGKRIEKAVSQKKAAAFLKGLATGNLEDRTLREELSKLGVSHIMAISGFHFALITCFFHLLFRIFLPAKFEAVLLILVTTLYLLYIGDSPSVVRAYIALTLFFLGQILERPISPLNALGGALCFSCLINPVSATTVSFQLSFLATGGILLLYTPLDKTLQKWLPKLPLKEVLEKRFHTQLLYLFGALFREAFALSLAVHLSLCPLLLTYFHILSFNSLLYNLFFPFLASFALLLLLLGELFGPWLHTINGYYSSWLLKISEHPPLSLPNLYLETLSPWITALYLPLLLLTALLYKEHILQTRIETA